MEQSELEYPETMNSDRSGSHLDKIRSRLCTILGHRWMYKNYSNVMKANGEKYYFSASRFCTRCHQHAYFYDKWVNSAKSIHDFDSEHHATDELAIDAITYN